MVYITIEVHKYYTMCISKIYLIRIYIQAHVQKVTQNNMRST